MSEPSAGMMVTPNVRLVRPLGEGGMGSVWVAEHLSLRTQVVVKFMARDLAKSQEAIARFSREAAAASQVKSPHVVQMLDHGVGEDGTPYIVMELLEGRDLEQHIRASGKVDPKEMIAVVAQLARALTKAHERGIVHRDIKPSNVFLLDAGGGELFVKLLDFGIAKGPEVGIVGSTTRTGSFVGSPYYMSPEQVVGAKNIDFRTDLWSLGVVAYEALTGDKPFYAETMGALALKIHRDPLPVPSRGNPALPASVDAWFAKACAREPGDRFASAKEMAEALAVALTGEAIPSGLKVDSVPSPRKPVALQTTLGVSSSSGGGESSTLRSGVDARSETGAGVGLVTSGQAGGGAGRSKWWMAAGVGLVALVIGFEAPKLVAKKTANAPAESAAATAAAVATTTASEMPILASPKTTAAAPSAAAGAPSRPAASAHTATPHAHPHAHPSLPAASARPTATATATAASPGSDDEIK